MQLKVLPASPQRWSDVEAVFAARGCSQARSCWCMYYRQSGAGPTPSEGQTEAECNRGALKALIEAGCAPGLIAYLDALPVGWVSLGPREEFTRLARSPVMKPVDELPVWSIVCFVVAAEYRGRGVARGLLAGAIHYARSRGAPWLEAYPVDKPGPCADDSLWFGSASMYLRAGLIEVARRKPERPVLRLRLAGAKS